MGMDVKELKELFDKEFSELKGLLEKQEEEIKTLGQSREETGKKVDEVGNRIAEISEELKKEAEKIAEVEENLKRIDEVEKKLGRPDIGAGGEVKSVGQLFVESDAYKNMVANNQLTSAPMRVKSLFDVKQITSTITGGTLTDYYRFPEIIQAPERALRIRDLLSVRTIGTDSVRSEERL